MRECGLANTNSGLLKWNGVLTYGGGEVWAGSWGVGFVGVGEYCRWWSWGRGYGGDYVEGGMSQLGRII